MVSVQEGRFFSKSLQQVVATFVAICSLVLLRFLAFCSIPITTDEAFTWRVIQYGWGDMVGRIAEDGHAPLYFILLKVYSLFAGSSLISLRLFSVLSYSLATTAHFGALQAALHVEGSSGKPYEYRAERLLLMVLLMFNPLQGFVAGNARMYALGLLFVSLSTWAILRALYTSGRNATLLWIAWGISTGMGMLTHHFVGFTAAGQTLAAFWIIQVSRGPAKHKLSQIASLIVGCLMAIVVYSPWLSIIRDQFSEVTQQFWIGPLAFNEVVGVLSSWLTGTPPGDWKAPLAILSIFLALCCFANGFRRRPLATVPFACQALLPWVLCLAISLTSGRPLLQDRYLVFGQASAFTAICLGWSELRSVEWRIATSYLLVGGHFMGLVSGSSPYHLKEDGFAQCVEAVLVHDDGNTSKTIFLRCAADVNRTRYFLDQAQRNDFHVKLLASPFRIGHVGHIAALDTEEIYWSPFHDLPELTTGAWVIYDEPGNSALGSLGGVETVAEFEIATTNSNAGKAILVRKTRQCVVPIP